ncbi:MAG: T9SS type A sorting domain-containing protein [Chitinophagaceae bacterium]|nr:MAG: T9SS type A sorting domain-containing protein [Chitinophagaceae bacterium]
MRKETSTREHAVVGHHLPSFLSTAFQLELRVCSILFAVFLLAGPAMAQNITTVTGVLKSACSVEPCGDGGPAKGAKLYSPSGMNVDLDGNIYIAEFSRHAVRKIDVKTGIITTFAGKPRTSCTVAPCGDGGLATNAQLNGPRGIGVDNDGNIYIADFSNHAIRKIDKNTGVITTVAGTLRGSCSTLPCGDGGLATNARLNSPTRVDFDSQGNMFIADYGNHHVFVTEYGNHTVRRIDKQTGIITTFAGTPRASCSVFPCGDGGSATAFEARLTSPFSLAAGPDNNIYIADASNAAIRKVDQATGIITTVAGVVKSSCGDQVCGEGTLATTANLANPFDVRFSPDGKTMYILEYSNQALRQVSNFSTLPVRMTELSAVRKGNVVDIAWNSHQEENVSLYEIERSRDGVTFSRVGVVTATGSGQARLNYGWQDVQPLQGFNFYRIKSVDKDKKFAYSTVVAVGPVKMLQKIAVSPNPVTGQAVQVQFTSTQTSQVELVLFNNAGQRVLSKIVIGTGTMQRENFELPAGLPGGIYTLYVGNSKEEIGRERLVIQ